MNLMESLRARVLTQPRRVVFPEGSNETIVEAAMRIAEEGWAQPILLRSQGPDAPESCSIGTESGSGKVTLVNPDNSSYLDAYVAEFCKTSPLPPVIAARLMRRPINYGCMMAKRGDADAVVAGIDHTTEQVIVAAQMCIGMREGVSIPSSYFVMDIPGFAGSNGSYLVFTDCALNQDPTPTELRDIALACADSVETLLGWIPKVALLSFSTRGSAVHPRTTKVVEALELIRRMRPELAVDGELQVDAAIVPSVAARKVPGDSAVAGKANILVFPSLEAANISLKLVQRLVGARAYGTVLAGFRHPISDLSRGSTVEDVIGAAIMVSCTVA